MSTAVHPMLIAMAKAMSDSDKQMTMGQQIEEIMQQAPVGTTAPALRRARAAVQALMEPTHDMLEIGMDYDEREFVIAFGTAPTPAQCVERQFQAMLRPLVEGEGE